LFKLGHCVDFFAMTIMWFCKCLVIMNGGDSLGSVVKKRKKKMRKHKHRKLLARTRHQRRKGK